MFITLVPSATFFVRAATNVSASSGSRTCLYSSGSEPSGVTGYGDCGFTGHSSLSTAHRLSYASASPRSAILIRLSVVPMGPILPSSLSDLTPFDIRGRIVMSIRSHRRMPPHNELSPHRPRDQLLDAALG